MENFRTTVDKYINKGYSVRDAHKKAHAKFPDNDHAKGLNLINSIAIGRVLKPRVKQYIYNCDFCRYEGKSNTNRCDICARAVYPKLIKTILKES